MLDIKLAKFINDVFGERCCGDVFDINERFDPDGNIKIIQIFLKKKTGIQKGWIEPDIFKELVKGIKAIVGDNDLLRITSAEAKQIVYIGGLEGEKKPEYKEAIVNKFDYKFIIEIQKKTEEQDEVSKPE